MLNDKVTKGFFILFAASFSQKNIEMLLGHLDLYLCTGGVWFLRTMETTVNLGTFNAARLFSSLPQICVWT